MFFLGPFEMLVGGSWYRKVTVILANFILFSSHTWMTKVVKSLDHFGYGNFIILKNAGGNGFCIKEVSSCYKKINEM